MAKKDEAGARSRSKYKAFLSVPLTVEQKAAIVRAARRLGLDYASFGRLHLLKETDYNPDKDPEVAGKE